MLPIKSKTKLNDTAIAELKKEMAKPRISRSAQTAKEVLDAPRISEPSSRTLSGSVDEIILSSHPGQTEKAHISIDGSAPESRGLRIENRLTNQQGNDVGLKLGARVDVTIKTKRTNKK